jgi:3-deoxy-D-manno-octulosonate 8-phosphate phosphatase (KDO 8-P phosphatase)
MPDLADIQMLVIDVDGVLTDGAIIINADGSESKFFNSLDGHGIRMWRRAGLKVAFLSGRESEPTKYRAEQLEIDYCIQNCHDKLPALEKLLEQLGLSADSTAYIGDDLPDLPAIRYVGFGIAVANAVDEVKQYADYVTTRRGGSGAVREVIEYILKNTGRWQELMNRYLPSEERGQKA